ncbi:MAG: hypothetical protein J1F39_02915 [Clostridiales bacterium]|nr:hypothetical protein [Clostridiales bacterium]
MSFKLKTLFMKSIIAKKQRKNPFDYEAGESFVLDENADPTLNNSYYFSAHGAESGQSLYCRLGVRSCHSEVWFYYSDGLNRYALKEMLYKDNPPLKVRKTDSGWKVEYSGVLTRGDGQKITAEFNGDYTSSESAVDFFSHMPAVRTAKAMAGEKWTKQFFAEVQNNNQVHYEQTGRLVGNLTLGGEAVKIDLPCVRDHSFGKRDWNYMNNHLWLMAVNETSQLNFSMVSYPAMSILEVGNFKSENRPMAYMLEADYDRAAVACGAAPDNLGLKITLDDKRTLDINVTKSDEDSYVFQDGDYTLIEGVADFTVNGEKYRGILEVGFNKDGARIYNGREIRELKV